MCQRHFRTVDFVQRPCLLITMKQGQGRQEADDGRTFYLWGREDLDRIFNAHGLICVDYSVQTSLVRKIDTWMSFVLKSRGTVEK